MDAPQPARPPSLPTEIVHRIIQLALPRVSFKTFRKRYDILLSFMLVDKCWMELGRRELVRHVLLKSEEQVQAFLDVMESSRLKGRPVQSLWADEHTSTSSKAHFLRKTSLRALIEACGPLHMLQMTAHHGWVSSASLRIPDKTKLHNLALDGIHLPSPYDSHHLPSLRRLALTRPRNVDHFVEFLARCSAPQLEALALEFSLGALPDDGRALDLALQRVAPQLRSLAFCDPFDATNFDFWVQLASLENLVLDSNQDLSSILAHLPCRLARLRLRVISGHPGIVRLETLIASLESTLPSLLDLKELAVAQPSNWSEDEMCEELESEQRREWGTQMERLRPLCSGRRVLLQSCFRRYLQKSLTSSDISKTLSTCDGMTVTRRLEGK